MHSKYSLLIVAPEIHNFHCIVDAVRKIEAREIIEGSLELKSSKAKQSVIPKDTDAGRFSHLTKTISSFENKKDKARKFGKKQKKNKL